MVSVESPDRLLSSSCMHPAAGCDECALPPDAMMPGTSLASAHRPAWAYSSELAQSYVGTAERTFKAAVVHLLETDYGVLGSQRVLDLLARDLRTLAEQFYPAPDHVPSGWMVFTGTKATGSKAYPGRSAADYELVTLA